MPSAPIEFSLQEKRTRFGLIADPKITVFVRARSGIYPFRFLLDTGADFSIIPFSMAEDLGIDLAQCPMDHCSGIQGHPLRVYHTRLVVRIGDVELTLRCLISESDTTPFLLGRADLFSRFNITFDNERKKIFLAAI